MSASAGQLVAVFADESCLGNGREGDNPGGAGGVAEWKHPRTDELLRWDFFVSEPATTNNRMALRSVIEVFSALSARGKGYRVIFTSDSRYIVDGMREWVYGWITRGWTRKTGPIENLALWQDAVDLVRRHQVDWRWVRGHAGHAQNEYANHLATRAAADQSQSGGFIASQFDEWIAGQKGKYGAAHPFPPADTFHAARSLPADTAHRRT